MLMTDTSCHGDNQGTAVPGHLVRAEEVAAGWQDISAVGPGLRPAEQTQAGAQEAPCAMGSRDKGGADVR